MATVKKGLVWQREEALFGDVTTQMMRAVRETARLHVTPDRFVVHPRTYAIILEQARHNTLVWRPLGGDMITKFMGIRVDVDPHLPHDFSLYTR